MSSRDKHSSLFRSTDSDELKADFKTLKCNISFSLTEEENKLERSSTLAYFVPPIVTNEKSLKH
jgi:hypothetical protein